LRSLRYVITDGYCSCSKQKFPRGVRALGLEQIGILRLDVRLRARSLGAPNAQGQAGPPTYDGQVNWDDLSRFATVGLFDKVCARGAMWKDRTFKQHLSAAFPERNC
jgi:hypothetical protein